MKSPPKVDGLGRFFQNRFVLKTFGLRNAANFSSMFGKTEDFFTSAELGSVFFLVLAGIAEAALLPDRIIRHSFPPRSVRVSIIPQLLCFAQACSR